MILSNHNIYVNEFGFWTHNMLLTDEQEVQDIINSKMWKTTTE